MADTATAPESGTNVLLRRWSVVTFKPELVTRGLVQQLLDAAILAPNHHLNQPWRFFVLTGRARTEFGFVLREALRARLNEPATLQSTSILDAEARKPLRAPVVVVAASVETGHPKALRHEDAAATAAAITHMMLAAPALGLGAYWRTGEPARDPLVKAFFGLKSEDEIVGFVYLGYPDLTRPPKPRDPAFEKTVWLGWGDRQDMERSETTGSSPSADAADYSVISPSRPAVTGKGHR